MGYSHSWEIKDPEDMKTAMPTLIDNCQRIIEYASINDEYKLDTPDFKDGIKLNGRGEYGHETFHFTHDYSNSCKTERKPYDLVVCAILLRAKHLVPNAVKISSDGAWNDWDEAVAAISALWPDMRVDCPWNQPGKGQSSANMSHSQTPYSRYISNQITMTVNEHVRNLYPQVDDARIETMIKFIETVMEQLRSIYPEEDGARIQEMIKQDLSRKPDTDPLLWLNVRQISGHCTLLDVLDMLRTRSN